MEALGPRVSNYGCLAAARLADDAKAGAFVVSCLCRGGRTMPRKGGLGSEIGLKGYDCAFCLETATGTNECVSAHRAWASKRENLLAHVQQLEKIGE